MSAESDDRADPYSHKQELKSPSLQRLKNQWKNLDGPSGVTEAYREGWDRIFGPKCTRCGEPPEQGTGLKLVEVWDNGFVSRKQRICFKCFTEGE